MKNLLGNYKVQLVKILLGDSFGQFSLESAQPYLDIYQGAQDAAVREIGEQTNGFNSKTWLELTAARGGAFGGSRLGITEAMLGAGGGGRSCKAI